MAALNPAHIVKERTRLTEIRLFNDASISNVLFNDASISKMICVSIYTPFLQFHGPITTLHQRQRERMKTVVILWVRDW